MNRIGNVGTQLTEQQRGRYQGGFEYERRDRNKYLLEPRGFRAQVREYSEAYPQDGRPVKGQEERAVIHVHHGRRQQQDDYVEQGGGYEGF